MTAGVGAGAAPASEDDVGGRHREPREVLLVEVGREAHHDVSDRTAALAHEVLVWLEVGVEPSRSGAQIDLDDLAHCGQVVQGLVHRTERHGGHLGARQGMHHISGRVLESVEDPKDQLPLRRDLESSLPEQVAELLG